MTILTVILMMLAASGQQPGEAPGGAMPARRFVAPAAPASAQTDPATASVDPAMDYLLGPGDLLDVTVFEEESLNRTVRIGPDGSIDLPLLGTLPAGGRRQSELRAEIVRRLASQFMRDPQVSVFVKEYRSRRVSVIGAVNSPGSYELLGRRTLLEVISEAGGLADNAGRDLFVFGQGADGSILRRRIDLRRLVREGDASLNLPVAEGEILSIPAEEPFTVYVYGAVAQPGVVEAHQTGRLTLLQAITRAGGPGLRAAVERIQVLRQGESGRLRLRANLKRVLSGRDEDLELQPGDVIVVPDSFF